MPFRIAKWCARGDSRSSIASVADSSSLDVCQQLLVVCLRQLVDVSRQATTVFADLQASVNNVATRTDRLHERSTALSSKVVALRDPAKQKITNTLEAIKGLRRCRSVKRHYKSAAGVAASSLVDPLSVPVNAFCSVTRGDVVSAAYALAQPSAIPMDDYLEIDSKATQTDKSAFTKLTAADTSVKAESSHNRTIEGVLVAVDVSGSAIKRLAENRQSIYSTIKKKDKKKRNILTESNTYCNIPNGGSPTISSAGKSASGIGETCKSNCNKPTPATDSDYDVIDHSTNIQAKARLYSSLRRPNRKKQLLAEEDNVVTNPFSPSTLEPRRIRAVIKRTLSFRRVPLLTNSIEQTHLNLEQPISHYRSRTLPKMSGRRNKNAVALEQTQQRFRRKFSLPMSKTSQVMSVASSMMVEGKTAEQSETTVTEEQIKQRCSKESSSAYGSYRSSGQNRPTSASSSGSPHLDGRQTNDQNCWYQKGFRVDDTPDTCADLNATIMPRSELSDDARPAMTATTSPISAVDSTDSDFSCDKDGYYTTMHHDSGVVVPTTNGQAALLPGTVVGCLAELPLVQGHSTPISKTLPRSYPPMNRESPCQQLHVKSNGVSSTKGSRLLEKAAITDFDRYLLERFEKELRLRRGGSNADMPVDAR